MMDCVQSYCYALTYTHILHLSYFHIRLQLEKSNEEK